MPKPLGGLAMMNADVMRRAEALQSLAMAKLRVEFAVEPDEVTLETLSYDRIRQDLERASLRGEEGITELNNKYAHLLLPVIEQVLNGGTERQPT